MSLSLHTLVFWAGILGLLIFLFVAFTDNICLTLALYVFVIACFMYTTVEKGKKK